MCVETLEILNGDLNQLSLKLAQGLTMVVIVEMAFMRFYLICKAKSMSSFLEGIQTWESPSSAPRDERFPKRRAGFLLLLSCMIVTLENMSFAIILREASLIRDYPWRNWLKGYPYSLSVFLLGWAISMAHVIVFALVVTSLDKMLRRLDGLCDYAESLIMRCSGNTTTGYNVSHVTLNIEVEPKKTTTAVSNRNTEVQNLLLHFRRLQSLFSTYNRLVGPLVLVMIVTSTVNLIDAINHLLNPRGGVSNNGWGHWVHMTQRCIYLTVLDDGHRARKMVSMSLCIMFSFI